MDIQKTIGNLKSEGFDVSYFETSEEAVNYITSQLSGKTIGIGGSQTVLQMGLVEKLMENNSVYCQAVDPPEDVYERAASAEVYISSVNGLAETGEIINIDGRGNRVSALLFGPKTVYYVLGVNKIAPDFASAMDRARNIAGPLNARRLNKKTPCAMGTEIKCYDCKSPERICRVFSITVRKLMGIDKMEIVIVNESLGY